MKKLAILGLLAFTLSLGYGLALAPATAEAGLGFCWYQCGCNGVPQYCCFNGSSTACKNAPWAPIQCPQIADC